MGRLIDADKLLETLQDLEPHCDNKHYENGMLCMLRKYIPQIINEQSTVYDLNKIIEQLEEMRIRYYLTYANTGSKTNDEIWKTISRIIDNIIKIMEGGGIE